MNNIYDILLNFNKHNFYCFFEWSSDDKISHIKKIPVCKISDDNMKLLLGNHVKIDNFFLEKIYNKTEVYTSKRVNFIPYSCIFSNNETCIAVNFNKNGEEISRSDLIIDEKDEVLELAFGMEIFDISFKIVDNITASNFITRYESNNIETIKSELKKAFDSNDVAKLRYIYYELYGVYEFDKNKIYNQISSDVCDNWSYKHEALVSIFKILNMRNQM